MQGLMEIFQANMYFKLFVGVDTVSAYITKYMTELVIEINIEMNKVIESNL